MGALVWLLIAVPLGTGAVLACTGRRGDRLAPAVGIVAASVTLVLAATAAVLRPAVSVPLFAGIDAGLAVDGLSAILVVTVATITLAVLVFATVELGPGRARARFTGLMLLFAGAMLVTVTATGLAVLLMGWEVMGATSWALIGYWWHQPHRVRAANVAFVTTRAADLGLYLAAGAALAGGVSTLALPALPDVSRPWLTVLTAGIVAAALGKSAQLPLHFWLSRAMEGPSSVSALLHSATMVAAGAYLLLRLQPLLAASGWGEPVVAWTGAATALVLGLVAVAQTDLKQLLAASTSAQIGFIVLAAGAGGVAAGTMHLVAHAATKSALFLAAGAWLTALGTKALPALRGAARRYRLVGVTFTVAAAALAGLPPLSLWVTKDAVLAAALQRSPWLYAVGLAAAVMAAVYSTKAAWVLWQPEPADAEAGWDTEHAGTRRVVVSAPPALVFLAGSAAVLGILALPPVMQVWSNAPGNASSPAVWELTLSALLALAAASVTWWWGDRPIPVPAAARRWAGQWLRFEHAADVLAVRPVMVLARGLAAFDDRALHRIVLAVPAAGLWLARLINRGAESPVDGLVRLAAQTARGLGSLARRPQTGQLHQYYAQAAVALAVLALFLVFVR
ncbi:NADH:ubiquinone oxidoreductase subunit 5 (subunit L)/multisubunit Na+/H+ antiporter MnhA subunit [Halopolyspora algeriensis]|uniref:NADH:ubiquinone oxidoreductase subunit 5 (Subunit L)/multisubunit Na+/H+ antiporter MnhA subunit n=1 Tax=Halopolyspora algeriensis TaxID=1500506 RepID=A0A368VVT3_9ACTN|nr:proton-conducting transporter membrane subunit [Halopolyspora algeriensis]RCW46214.1 NADH:ubiquinone oxidoreductase subunit 5 (subunit L)/multisubunit Na+/H+ antiporter MnhA subunit [Halopolyspora algeriensis]TQM55617.1 NADH:ubiquinone oxidoreductase subunit 5 (subunit L)/multisubunit Na+/H+ antiporter MnhA subunit [Halopolyspora algeriensis]